MIFYIFPKIDTKKFNIVDDEKFALDFLDKKHVLIVHGTGFNWSNIDHFRIVYLADNKVMEQALNNLQDFLKNYKQK